MAAETMTSMWSLFGPAVAFVVVTAAALALRGALLLRVRRWIGTTARESPYLRGVRPPSVLWCAVLGLAAALATADLPERWLVALRALLEVLIILSVTVTLAGILGSLVAAASERRGLGIGVTSFAQTAVRLVVLIVGGLVLLSSLGIQVAPLVAALGVGGLAVALALQDTLGNLFAVIHLLTDRPLRVGDWVKIAETIEGRVEDIGWRSTRIRAPNDVLVIVPNKRVAESVVVNYDLPRSRMALTVVVRVALDSDPDRVDAVLADEARRAVGVLDGLLQEPPPAVQFMNVGDLALDFGVVVWIRGVQVQGTVQHELRMRLVRRLRAEGIALALRPQPR